jgi:hypothetical protein
MRAAHCFVHEPLDHESIAIVAVLRNRRDLPTILQKWADVIERELAEARAALAASTTTAKAARPRGTRRRRR